VGIPENIAWQDPTERREEVRVPIQREGTVRVADDGDSLPILISNLHREGCRIDGSVELSVNQTVMVGIPGIGLREARVKWKNDGAYGACFLRPLPAGSVGSALADNVHPLAGTPSPVSHAQVRIMPIASRGESVEEKWSPRARLALFVAMTFVGGTMMVSLADLLLS